MAAMFGYPIGKPAARTPSLVRNDWNILLLNKSLSNFHPLHDSARTRFDLLPLYNISACLLRNFETEIPQSFRRTALRSPHNYGRSTAISSATMTLITTERECWGRGPARARSLDIFRFYPNILHGIPAGRQGHFELGYIAWST